MSTIEERLIRLERRQEDLIATLGDLAGIVGTNHDLLQELMEWLQKPASTELADLLKSVVVAVTEQGERINTLSGIIIQLGGRIGDVPVRVAELLRTGVV